MMEDYVLHPDDFDFQEDFEESDYDRLDEK